MASQTFVGSSTTALAGPLSLAYAKYGGSFLMIASAVGQSSCEFFGKDLGD